RRIELGADLVVVQPARPGAMDHPDVVVLVDPHADRPAEQPVVGQRFRPQRVDHEARRLHGRALRFGLLLQDHLPDAEPDDAGNEHRAGDPSGLGLDHRVLPVCASAAHARAAFSCSCGDYRAAQPACKGGARSPEPLGLPCSAVEHICGSSHTARDTSGSHRMTDPTSPTKGPDLTGAWRKTTTSACARKYPETIRFEVATYLGTRG